MKIDFTLFLPRRVFQASVALLTGLMLIASFGAQAQGQFPVTPELLDSRTGLDATWPHDPAVPDLPPLPVTDDPVPVKDSFLNTHYFDGVHPPKVEGPPPPLRAVVTEQDPLKVDVLWSMRSPYSYLVLQRHYRRMRKSIMSPGRMAESLVLTGSCRRSVTLLI